MGALPQFPLPVTSLSRPSTRSPTEMFSVENYLSRSENIELEKKKKERTPMNIIEEGKGCKEQTTKHMNEPRGCRHRLKFTSS